MLKNAPILILDEATSSLDSETENAIQDRLIPLMKGKTTLIITHHLSTLNHVDRILRFEEGKDCGGTVMKTILYLMILAFGLCKPIVGAERPLPALILIVASDDYPIYTELQKCWRSYMHSDPDHIGVYFVKANPNLSSSVQVVGDTIWCQTPDGFCEQNNGIIMKTLYAFEHVLPKIRNEVDYVMRTNLSTFCIFPRFLNYLKTLPKTCCFAGVDLGENIASGTGIILSSDMAELLAAHKDDILNHLPDRSLDDATIGRFFHRHDIRLISHSFMGVYNFNEWERIKNAFPAEPFQVHIKTALGKNYLTDRIPGDLAIHSDLFHMFYWP